MIWFITGKPGDGKSYAATKIILEYLRDDTRPIVTNIILNRSHVASWLVGSGMHPVKALRVVQQRVFHIGDGDLQEFYRHRGPVFLDPKDDITIRGQKESQPDYARSQCGIIFFLDEIHIAFPARGWQGSGDRHLFYNSQHRRLLDDVFFITQSAEQVDKTFRLLAQGYYSCRNFYRLKFGMFRHGGYLQRTLTYDIPRKGVDGVFAERIQYPLDKKIGACYETMSGVGIKTTNKPELVRAKGIPLKALLFVAPVALFGIIWSMDAGRASMSKWFGSTLTGQASSAQKAVVPRSRSAPPSVSDDLTAARVPAPVLPLTQPKPWPVFFRLRGSVVIFSDGSEDHVTRHKLTARGRNFAVVDGVTVPAS